MSPVHAVAGKCDPDAGASMVPSQETRPGINEGQSNGKRFVKGIPAAADSSRSAHQNFPWRLSM